MDLAEAQKYYRQGKSVKAIEIALELFDKGDKSIPVLEILSASYLNLKQYDKAIEYANIGYKSNCSESKKMHIANTLGLCYDFLGEFDIALRYYKNSIKFGNKHHNPYSRIMLIYIYKKMYREAKEYVYKLRTLNIKDRVVDYDISFYYRFRGDYRIGFDLYRARYSRNNSAKYITKNIKLVLNSNILDKHNEIKNQIIYISKEQGFGDIINFIRFLPILKKRGAKKIILNMPTELKRLFKYNYSEMCEFVEKNMGIAFNYHFPIMDFAYILDTSADEIPFKDSYLKVDKNDSNMFYNTYFKKDKSNKPNIGIVFRSSNATGINHSRSLGADKLLKHICKISHMANIYSLQYEPTEDEKKLFNHYDIIDVASHFKDFYDTALAIDNLDFVISVDTSVAHICGAMGKKTYLLLSYIYDWRWGDGQSQNNWYNSIKLYRQSSPKTWDDLLEKLLDDIKALHF